MSHAILKSGVMLAWLAGLAAILLIDAIRKLVGNDSAVSLPKPQNNLRAADAPHSDAVHELFEKSADEPLHPEPKPGLALRDQRSSLPEFKKSA